MNNHRSTAELEREAEAARRRVAYTAETLRHKMSLGQMVDEAADYLRHSDGTVALHNLKNQMRDNPLPLALVGAGLAWFFLGGGPSTDRLRQASEGYRSRDGDDRYVPDLWAGPSTRDDPLDWESALEPMSGGDGRSNGNGAGMRDAARAAASKVSGAASAVSDAAGSAYGAASDAASSAGEAAAMARRRAARAGSMAVDRTTRAGQQVRHRFSDMLDRDPLILGVLGIAAGAAIAAMLPRTRYEDETVGPYRDQLRDEAEQAVSKGMEEAKAVAAETYEAAKDEARRQDSSTETDRRPMAEKIADIAETAAETAEDSTRSRIGS